MNLSVPKFLLTHLISLNLPEDLQFAVLLKLENKSLLSFYRSCKKAQVFIENRLPNFLKKAKLNEQGFLQWKNVFKDIIHNLQNDSSAFVEMTKKYSFSYSKEIFTEFKKAFKLLHNYQNVYENVHNAKKGITSLIKASQVFSTSYPKTLVKILEQVIHSNLEGKKIKPNTVLVALECINVIATVDFKKAVEIYNSLEFLDPKTKEKFSNQVIEAAIEGPTKRHAEAGLKGNIQQLPLFELVDFIANGQLEKSGLLQILNYTGYQFTEEDLSIIQKVLDISESFDDDKFKTSLKREAILAYAKMGQFEKSIKMIDELQWASKPEEMTGDDANILFSLIESCRKKAGDPKRVECFLQKIYELINQEKIHKQLLEMKEHSYFDDILVQLAKAYIDVNQQETENILDTINLIHLNEFSRADIAQIYMSIHIQKAIEIAHGIENDTIRNIAFNEIAPIYVRKNPERAPHILDDLNLNYLSSNKKFDLLLEVSFVFKEGNKKIALQILELAFAIAQKLKDPYRQNLNFLKIINHRADINPTEARQFLEKNNITIKELFFNENIHASFKDADFIFLALVYAKLDPNGAEDRIKAQKYWVKMNPNNQAKTFMSIADAIKRES